MKFDIVVSYDKNRGIGLSTNTLNKGMLWSFASDMKHFRELTQESTIIMGRKTYELIGSLPYRINIVVTSYEVESREDTFFMKSFEDALDVASQFNNKIFVIGGGQIYKAALRSPYLNNIYITEVDHQYNCDIFFDKINYKIESCETVEDYDRIKQTYQTIRFIKCKLVQKLHEEYQYLNLIERLINEGTKRKTRNAITRSLFGEKMVFDLAHFPLYTTKKMFMRGIFEELKFFLQGKTNSKELEAKGVNIWQKNTSREFLDNNGFKDYPEGEMGPMYFFNVLHFGAEYEGCDKDYTNKGYNQFEYVMNLLKTDPFSRRILFTTYNPSNAKDGVLYPCHGLITQFYVDMIDNKKYLSCSMTMRSNDIICGNPFNVASYALMVYIMCELLGDGFVPGKLIMFLNDVHIYEEHIEAAKEQIKRVPYQFPKLRFKKKFTSIEELEWEDIEITNYVSHPPIKVEMIG